VVVTADTAGRRADRIESLLSARLFVEPQLTGDRLTFGSNLAGHLSLFAMSASGGVPEPILPPQIALQNPELVGGHLFHVLPRLEQIVVMLDSDGDENYVPHVVPLDGGFPEPLAESAFAGGRAHLVDVHDDAEIAYFAVESRVESSIAAIRVELSTGEAETLWASPYGAFVAAWTPDHSRVISPTATRWATSCCTRSSRVSGRCSSGPRSRSATRPPTTRCRASAAATRRRAGSS
jgi:hypothetical protein